MQSVTAKGSKTALVMPSDSMLNFGLHLKSEKKSQTRLALSKYLNFDFVMALLTNLNSVIEKMKRTG